MVAYFSSTLYSIKKKILFYHFSQPFSEADFCHFCFILCFGRVCTLAPSNELFLYFQVTALPKPVSQAIPVARVCPQPNVVTITTTVGNVITQGTQQQNSVFIARSGSGVVPTGSGGAVGAGQPVAINLSSIPATLNLSKPNVGNPAATLSAAKITVPSQQARLVNLPAQPVQLQVIVQFHLKYFSGQIGYIYKLLCISGTPRGP